MMQPCASAARLRGGGPTLNRGSRAMFGVGLPPPRIVIGGPSRTRGPAPKPSRGPLRGRANVSGRRATPSGASPVVTSLHSAISSFLARATTIALRVPPRASAVRARYQRASWLSPWKRRKRQASWSMPRRTRALPTRARPFSRRQAPLSSGEPVSPAQRASALRSRSSRESTSRTSMSAVSVPTPTTRASRRTIACGRSSAGARPRRPRRAAPARRARGGALPQPLGARRLDLRDLLPHEPQPGHVAAQLGERVRRQRRAFRRAQRRQALRGLAQGRLEAADAEAGQGALHPVHDPGALADQALALAARALGVLLLQRRHRGRGAVARLAAQPAQEGALEQPGVQAVGLGAPVLPRDRDAGRVDDVGLDAAGAQPAREPEPVAA